MTHWEQIGKDNKLVMMALAKLEANDTDNLIERNRLIAQLRSNNSDLQAYAVALGPRDQMPRIVLFKQQREKQYKHGQSK